MKEVRWSTVELDDRRRWDLVVRRVPHSFSHTWEHCRVHARQGERLVLIHAEWASGEAICPLRMREGRFGYDVATPFGFSGFCGRGDLGGFPDLWRTYAELQGWVTGYHVINPWLDTPPWRVEDGLYVHNSLFALDLTLGQGTLYERLSRTRRRQIRSWRAEGRHLVTDKAVLRAFIGECSQDFYERMNAGPDYRLDGSAWDLLLSSDNTLVLGAASGGRPVAAILFGAGSVVADAMFMVALPAGRDALGFLVWSSTPFLVERGMRMLNVGGGLSRTDSIAEAKRRLGGEEVEFAAVRQVYQHSRYEAACREAGCASSTGGRYFPPYRAAATEREDVG